MSSSGGLWDYKSKSQQGRLAESSRMGPGRNPQSMASDASG